MASPANALGEQETDAMLRGGLDNQASRLR
jgi:hypothetical protein